MYYNDHAPAHFHVRYGEQKATINVESFAVIQGRLTPRVQGLVTEWAALHQAELLENWRHAARLTPLFPIVPLEEVHAARYC